MENLITENLTSFLLAFVFVCKFTEFFILNYMYYVHERNREIANCIGEK
jgi:hypothetical protein